MLSAQFCYKNNNNKKRILTYLNKNFTDIDKPV